MAVFAADELSSHKVKKVLVVSPHFPPVNAPDMQRVRMALPHLRALGWEPTVLALDPASIEGGAREPLLETTYPADVRIVRARGISPALTRRIGFGGLWLRCGRALRVAAESLLRGEQFDLAFFSTTQFDAFALGPRWQRKFGVRYVLDYQDPWINPYYARTRTCPPGGKLKFALAQFRARRHEPATLRDASGIVAVSNAYGPMLAQRYPWFDANRVVFLPFGAADGDLQIARRHTPASPLVPRADGLIHHVYAGRGGSDVAPAVAMLLRGFKHYLKSDPAVAGRLRLHFIGTSYAPAAAAAESVMPIARALGVEAFVQEHPTRVPYFDALSYLINADAILALGSQDATYSASKIFPYLLARRPLLILFHHRSAVHSIAESAGAGLRIAFDHDTDVEQTAVHIFERWFKDDAWRRVPVAAPARLEPFTAEAMTAKLRVVFDHAVGSVLRGTV